MAGVFREAVTKGLKQGLSDGIKDGKIVKKLLSHIKLCVKHAGVNLKGVEGIAKEGKSVG